MTKRGASLIWAMVMSTALLFIAVTTATFVIRESQMSIRMDESSLAYAAAESGIDWGKYCVQSQCAILTPVGTSFGPFYVGGSKYVVTIKKEATQTKIESTGTSNGVNRKLEHIIKNASPLDSVSDANLTGTLQVDGSYVQQFDYWATGSSFANIGLGNLTEGIYLRHGYSDGKPYIFLTTTRNGETKETGLSLDGVNISSPYSLRIRIEYFKDLSAKMTVSKRNFASNMPEFSCIGSELVMDVRDLGFSPASFTKFYFNSALTTETDPTKGDGSVKKLINGSNEAYFDNMATSGIVYAVVPVTHRLSVTLRDNNQGRVTSPPTTLDCGSGQTKCDITIPDKTAITLKAEAQPGETFKEWSGTWCQDKTSTTCEISANKVISDIGVTAIFDR